LVGAGGFEPPHEIEVEIEVERLAEGPLGAVETCAAEACADLQRSPETEPGPQREGRALCGWRQEWEGAPFTI
jgi:hypothetical protein